MSYILGCENPVNCPVLSKGSIINQVKLEENWYTAR